MGADFLLASLVIDKARKPDFAAGQAAIEYLEPDQIELTDEFDADPDTEDGMALRHVGPHFVRRVAGAPTASFGSLIAVQPNPGADP